MSQEPDLSRLPAPDTIRSKGFTLKGATAFAEARFGAGAMERVLPLLEPDLREVLSVPVLSSTWYPFRYQVALYEGIDRAFGAGDFALCRQIGRYTAETEATSFHKVLLKLANMKTWLKIAGSMWGMYYSAGNLSAEAFHDAGGVARISGFHPISKAFCEDFAGWLEQIIKMGGKTEVSLRHTECVLDGAPACLYKATWHG